MLMLPPERVGTDAVTTVDPESLELLDTAVVKGYEEQFVLAQILPVVNLNKPGLDQIKFNVVTSPRPASTSKHGDEDNVGNYGLTEVTNNFAVTNQKLQLKYYDIEQSKLFGIPVDTNAADMIGEMIGEGMEYNLMNGHDGTAMDGILDFDDTKMGTGLGIQDAGAPSGVWDVAGETYDSVNLLFKKLRDKSFTGKTDIIISPGLLIFFDYLLHDGTAGFDKAFSERLAELTNGGKIYVSSHPFTASTTVRKGQKATGTTGGADNWMCAVGEGAFEIQKAHELKRFPLPSQEGDLYYNYKVKYTLKAKKPWLFVFMDAIDTVT